MLENITVVILTYNEKPNIARQLSYLAKFSTIVVVDSGSDDGTDEIVNGFPNTRLVQRAFDNHASQWNYALSECDPRREWVLALDADYLMPPDLIDELSMLQPSNNCAGYSASFRYCVYGRALSGSLYPDHVVLFRRDQAHFVQDGHTQRLALAGGVEKLLVKIDHDDRKPLKRWFSSQMKYAELEAEHILGVPDGELRPVDKLRKSGTLAPILVFFYTLFVKRCLFDGWRGWLYVLQRTLAELVICALIVDRRVRGD